ncbi:pentatricopeptide repeat-containing protein At3g53700, chloroplastic-like [Arachis duranensis]|uniref:Pentatricopeptide repeat-containing protein At3g53700, chloroplastic-like n=1 Tax=Arachis duranensis TaxID=130453 RepID=A0A6P4D9K8_ARADU|nr:pentatricopeptide repeat-containing protein At3g53700, chloroplastic-like [Arachis duranensis]
MLCVLRNRNGGACFSITCHLFNNLSATVSVHSSPPQSILSTNSIVPTRKTPPTTSSSSSSPLAVSICSLLCHRVSSNSDNIDNVLGPYKGVLSSKIVLRVLMSYKQLGRAKTLNFFSWAGTHMGFQLDHSVVEYMLDFLCRRKLFDDMKCLLMTVSLHNQGSVSCKALSICIRFLGRNGRIREALSLFDEMGTVFRCKPDNLVYNNMLYVLCKRQSSEEMVDLALSIFRRIESPDTYSCSNMLVGLCKVGRLEAALEIFGRMDEIGVIPSRSAVNILIGELCSMSAKEGSVEKLRVKNTRRPYTILVPNVGCSSNTNSGSIQPAIAVFRAVHRSGLWPSSFVVVKFISELCRLGKTEEAVEILMIAEEKKLTCVGEGYSIVIRASCEQRRVEEASKLFGRMLQHGLKPKLVVYNSIISMLCKLGNLNDATRVYEIMNKKRCLPDNSTYAALIHANGERKNWKVAYDLLTEMLGFGWIPHFHTYNLVDSLLREHDQLDLCCKLERKLENKKLQKLCKIGQLDAAYEKAKSMLEKGICLSPSARDTFKDVFQKCGKLNVVRQLLETTDRA